MPRKTKTTAEADKAAQPQFSAELLEQLIPGPVTPAELQGLRQLKQMELGLYEMRRTVEVRRRDGRTPQQDQHAGHVIVQELPVWLPRVRLDGR